MDGTVFNNLVRRHMFGDLLCQVYGKGAFLVVERVGSDGHSMLSWGDWAGPVPEGESDAPFVAQVKAAELFRAGDPNGLSMTPIAGFKKSLGWMGGVRHNDNIVAVSKWDQRLDRLLAMLVLYAIENPVELYLGSWRHATQMEALAASKVLNLTTIYKPASDHQSWFNVVENDLAFRCFHYTEQRWYPCGPHTRAFEWGLVTPDPRAMLVFIASAYSQVPKFFVNPGENDPVGVVWIMDDDGSQLGVMARANWWKIK